MEYNNKLLLLQNPRIYILGFWMLLGLTILLASCNIITAQPDMQLLIPRETEVPGWELRKDTMLYATQDILTNPTPGLQEKLAVNYRSFSNYAIVIALEIQKYPDPVLAFGQFSSERGFSQKNTNIISQGEHTDSYSSDKGFFIRYNNYYLKLTTDNSDDSRTDDLKHFASIIAGKLSNSQTLQAFPDYIATFVFDGKTEKARDFLMFHYGESPQLPGLASYFTTRQKLLNKETIIFYKACQTPYQARQNYKLLLQTNASSIIITKAENLEVAIKKDNDGYTCFSTYEQFLFGISNVSSILDGEKTISLIYKKIKR